MEKGEPEDDPRSNGKFIDATLLIYGRDCLPSLLADVERPQAAIESRKCWDWLSNH